MLENEVPIQGQRPYEDEPVAELFRMAAEDANRRAIDEILQRELIVEEDARMKIHAYIGLVCRRCSPRSSWKSADEIREDAASLAFDRFHNLPENGKLRNGPDCRNQYRAVLKNALDNCPARVVPILEEGILRALKRSVERHTRQCVREALRSVNPYVHRYRFEGETGAATLWMPRYMEGKRKRKWLRDRFPDPLPKKAMQEIVDRELNFAAPRLTKDCLNQQARDSQNNLTDWESVHGLSRESLAEIVSKEKASALDLLPPSIAKLGAGGVRSLVIDLFSCIDDPDYIGRGLAERHGLSPSALSRFAGTKWNEEEEIASRSIPLLWRNCAKVLAASDEFRDAAQTAGVWERVQILAAVEGRQNDGTK